MRVLYKYLPPGTDDEPVPVSLRTQSFLAADPRTFNDPFEVRPWFDQERQRHFARGHEGFYRGIGVKHSLISDGSMADVPVENAVGFAETLNKRFRDELGKRFRILCLTASFTNVLMWGHYAHSYRGVVVGLDVENPDFSTGLRPEGFQIDYSLDRSKTRLPLAYYQFPPVERFDVFGAIANSPNEEVVGDGGLVIPFSIYRQQIEEACIRAITTKAQSWGYEQEVRFIYELPTHATQLRSHNHFSLVPLPCAAVRELIIGFNASVQTVDGILALFDQGAFGNAQLFYTTCHPNLFEVQKHEADPNYLRDYFHAVLPSH